MTIREKLRFGWLTLTWSLRVGCAVHLIHDYTYEFTETRGESMLPTLQNYFDFAHALKKYKLGRGIEMGDCIVAMKPTDPDHRVCKRVTGMPGDLILIDPSSSSMLTNTPGEIIQHDGFNKYIRIPKGHVWCTGDNLSHSLDSRSYSALPMGLIIGKIVGANHLDKGVRGYLDFRRIKNTFIDEE
ncbi:Mitochondrial inner membrane protease subunit 1 [Spathaspora sp. JA1]|nr:Mitochondrial inner membrane protease subunit 1 [Spathaspora sp. JA1]